MKKLFLLLFALICFRFSYGEDLSPEKQQLAWKFIYENLLSKDYLPTIFKYRDNIVLNVNGEVTSDDSLVVKNLIKSIQRNIPNLKIELSDKKGSLILGLNDKKKHKVSTATVYDNHTIYINESYKLIPDRLTSYQRKQFIYYQLFKGLVFYKKPQQDLPGMNGCVFAETDFKSITFSPLDLFILEKLYAPNFSVLLSQNLDPGLQQTAWNSIFLKFMGETKNPIIFRDYIKLKLEGTPSPADSACMNELINDLKEVIPTTKIYFANENANLIFSFNDATNGTGTSTTSIFYTILAVKNSFKFSPDISKDGRKKILYYYLYRSLVHFSPSKTGTVGINGCVYDETKPESITYNPVDAFMLNRLYADDFNEQFKNYFVGHYSYRGYLIQMYHNELDLGFFLLGLLLSTIFLSVLIIKNVFKTHHWNWLAFNKQGLFLIAIGVIYTICLCSSDLKLDSNDLFTMKNLVLSLFLAVNLIYIIEKKIFKNHQWGGSGIAIHFFITLIVLIIVSYPPSFKWSAQGLFPIIPTRYNLLLPYILTISLARSLYIFLYDIYKSIINQKDVELAQMGELQKQAELQSLRAKINPHFLYNALNSIASLASTDARKTEQMALALSDFFKYAINREQKQLNSLSEELNATRTYLEIEKVRFGDRLNFVIDCDPKLSDIQIPQLLIQPLVENAIKHGLSKITENGLIRIVITKDDHQVNVRVYDNGPAFPDGPLTGFGIQNTQERIALLYGAKATINWNNLPEKYIELSLPFVNQLPRA